MLAARNAAGLEDDRADLTVRYGVGVTLHEYDTLDTGSVADFVAGLPALPEVVVCAVGLLGDQQQSEADPAEAEVVMRSNFIGPALVLGAFAERMVARGSGALIGISSVAGERGRASNYVYGSAKAGFTAFLSGLRNRLGRSGVQVLTVKPGFVDTAMTWGLPGLFLVASPDAVARTILRGVDRKRGVIYVPGFWWAIMLIIRAIPEPVFRRMKI